MTNYIKLAFACAAVCLAVLADPLSAQQGTGVPRRVAATILLVDRTPAADEAFVVQRRGDAIPHDIILLRRDANASQLSEAIRTLLTARALDGDTASRASLLRMRRRANTAESPAAFPWTGRVLADLRKAEVKTLPGVATGRAVEIWLPPQRRAGMRQ